jgi:hypothetical protein
MLALWLIVPAVLFLAKKPKDAAPAASLPTQPEQAAAISQDVQFVARNLHAGTTRGTQLAAGARQLLDLDMLHSTFFPPPTQPTIQEKAHVDGRGGWRGK